MSERPKLSAALAVEAAKQSSSRTMQLLASHLEAMTKRRAIVSIVVCLDVSDDNVDTTEFENTVVISNVPAPVAAEVMEEYVKRFRDVGFEATPKDN